MIKPEPTVEIRLSLTEAQAVQRMCSNVKRTDLMIAFVLSQRVSQALADKT